MKKGTQGARQRLNALSRLLHSPLSTRWMPARQRIAVGSPNGDRSAHSDHALTVPLEGGPATRPLEGTSSVYRFPL